MATAKGQGTEEKQSTPKRVETRFKTRQLQHLKRKGDEGIDRAEAAEGAAWLQWRKVARKEYKGEGQRRRSSGRGRRRKGDQESDRPRSGCMHKEKVRVHEGDKEVVQRPAGAKCYAKLGLLANLK